MLNTISLRQTRSRSGYPAISGVFLSTTGIEQQDTLLDLGVTSDRTYSHSNYLELWYP